MVSSVDCRLEWIIYRSGLVVDGMSIPRLFVCMWGLGGRGWPCLSAYGILVPQPRTEPVPPAVET